MQVFWPFPFKINYVQIKKNALNKIFQFSIPIWVSHICYILFNSIAILGLEHFHNQAEVGKYSVVKTISLVFFFIPSSIATLLMPKSASLSKKSTFQLLKKMNIDTVVIVGIQTPNCIRATAFDSVAYDYVTYLVEDAVAAQTEEIHNANVRDMGKIGIGIVKTSEIGQIE